MCKKELVAKILARKKAQFVAADAPILEQLSEERLKVLAEAPDEPEPKPEPKPEPETPEQRRSKLLSENPDIKAVLDKEKARETARHSELLTAMKATKQDAYTEEELKALPLEALEKIVKVANANVPVKDYSGSGLPRAAAAGDETAPPPVDMMERIKTLRAKSA